MTTDKNSKNVQNLFSPKEVATALAVSEASIKRWVDQGIISSDKTPGGHRKISLSSVIQFARNKSYSIAKPEILGLSPFVGLEDNTSADFVQLLVNYLVQGNEKRFRSILFEIFLQGKSCAEMFDQVLGPCFHQIGDLWHTGKIEIFEERRATDFAYRVIHEIGSLLPEPLSTAPSAIGGSLSNDYYQIPNLMIEITLKELGWNAQSLGPHLPLETMLQSLQKIHPHLFWLSISHVENSNELMNQVNQLFSECRNQKIPLVVGGRAIQNNIRTQLQCTTVCDSMKHLVNFIQSFSQKI